MPEIPPPNIVLILVDDADAKVLEHAACSRIRAALGVGQIGTATASRYLTTHPLCGPSRASILRGMYPQNTGVIGNNGVYGAFKSHGGETSNIARWLKAAPVPYRTAMIGKYLNGYRPADDFGNPQDPRPNAASTTGSASATTPTKATTSTLGTITRPAAPGSCTTALRSKDIRRTT